MLAFNSVQSCSVRALPVPGSLYLPHHPWSSCVLLLPDAELDLKTSSIQAESTLSKVALTDTP